MFILRYIKNAWCRYHILNATIYVILIADLDLAEYMRDCRRCHYSNRCGTYHVRLKCLRLCDRHGYSALSLWYHVFGQHLVDAVRIIYIVLLAAKQLFNRAGYRQLVQLIYRC